MKSASPWMNPMRSIDHQAGAANPTQVQRRWKFIILTAGLPAKGSGPTKHIITVKNQSDDSIKYLCLVCVPAAKVTILII